MNLKPIESADVRRIATWNLELHEDEGSVPMSVDDATQRLLGWLASGKFHGLIFLHQSLEVGYLLYEEVPGGLESRSFVDSIYVRQFYIVRQSRRRGIGSEAFRCFLAAVGDKRVTLEVKSTNPDGQRFWESLGFTPREVVYQLN